MYLNFFSVKKNYFFNLTIKNKKIFLILSFKVKIEKNNREKININGIKNFLVCF